MSTDVPRHESFVTSVFLYYLKHHAPMSVPELAAALLVSEATVREIAREVFKDSAWNQVTPVGLGGYGYEPTKRYLAERFVGQGEMYEFMLAQHEEKKP